MALLLFAAAGPLTILCGDDRPVVPFARVSPPGQHVFFGYYDVPAVDAATKRHLAHRVPFRDRLPTTHEGHRAFYVAEVRPLIAAWKKEQP